MWNLRTRLFPLFGVIVLVWVFFYYSFDLVNRLREARARSNETIAWFWAGAQVPLSTLADMGMMHVCSECGATYPAYSFSDDTTVTGFCKECGRITKWFFVSVGGFEERDQLLSGIRRLFRELVERLDYTTVLTDVDMTPQIVNGVVVDDSISPDSLGQLYILIRELNSNNDPIPITDAAGDPVGYLHYGSDDLERELIVVPYIEMSIIVVILLLFLFVVRSEMKREKELSWVGFAKETAHQISTPLSSLMGWIEILREKPEEETDAELAEALECMEDDVERLRQIASRYGQMGKKPKFEKTLVNPVILDTIHYFCGRPGLVPGDIDLQTDLQSVYPVKINGILFGWVIENLLKNSLAAVKGRSETTIRITTRDVPEASGRVEIEIADTGRGIPFSQQKKVFRAGFSTRRGGWGLGLTLSRRIIERYHRGSLRLKASSPGSGTTFVIHLPAAKGDEQ